MHKKTLRLLSLMLALIFSLGCFSFASAEEQKIYKLGDQMEDFTVTLSDGQEINLYSLLEEKKVVLLNFWASWCSPCKAEFPYLQDAYTAMSDDVGMICLSTESSDKDESILELTKSLGVSTVPVGRDIGLYESFGLECVPVSVLIDRNKTICLIHGGMFPSTKTLTYTLESFTGDDYDKPLLLNEVPELPMTRMPSTDEMNAALNAEGGSLEFVALDNGDSTWPFVPSESGNSAVPSNLEIQSTSANVYTEIEHKAGDVLTYDVCMDGYDFDDRLVAFLNADVLTMYSGEFDWTTFAYRFDEDGTDAFTLVYYRSSRGGYTPKCEIRNIRLLTGDEAVSYEIPIADECKSLDGLDYTVEIVSPENPQTVDMLADGQSQVETIGGLFVIVPDDTVQLKVCLGKDWNASLSNIVCVEDMQKNTSYTLTGFEHDEEGYLVNIDLSGMEESFYISVNPNSMDASVGSKTLLLFHSTEAFLDYMLNVLTLFPDAVLETLDQYTYEFVTDDGEVFCDHDTFAAAVRERLGGEAVPASPAYSITFTDAAGQPISGVAAQICDDSTCSMYISDENGLVTFEGQGQSFQLHVLKVPAGYESVSNVYDLPSAGSEMSIMLTAAAE